jgi:hypothetical protein
MQAASTPRTDLPSETESSSRRAKCRACSGRSSRPQRKGFAVLDYALVLGVILPVAAALLWMGPKIMMLVYEMTAVIISWPFM